MVLHVIVEFNRVYEGGRAVLHVLLTLCSGERTGFRAADSLIHEYLTLIQYNFIHQNASLAPITDKSCDKCII